MAFKKRQIMLASLVMALGTAVYLNWQFSPNRKLAMTKILDSSEELGESQYVNGNNTEEEKTDNKKEPESNTQTKSDAKSTENNSSVSSPEVKIPEAPKPPPPAPAPVQPAPTVTQGDYFSKAKQERQKNREEASDMIKETMNRSSNNETAKAEAVKQVTKIAKTIQEETNIENLLKAKGFNECLVTIKDDACSIIVGNKLDEKKILIIKDVIAGQSNLSLEKLKVAEVER